jgi:hypothetical protein
LAHLAPIFRLFQKEMISAWILAICHRLFLITSNTRRLTLERSGQSPKSALLGRRSHRLVGEHSLVVTRAPRRRLAHRLFHT